MELQEIENIVEGILFAMGGTVEASRMAKALEVEEELVISAVTNLKNKYEAEKRGISITEIDGSYQMCTNPDIYDYLIKIAKQPRKYQLTDVLLETLSIVAYKQPITKSEIEKIRGVSSDFAVSKLVEYGLVAELGRLDAPGRPMLFGTTEDFLRSFGVSSLDDLPELSQTQIEEFKMEAETEASKVEVNV
ncbi:MAG: SMC-Scp complex subunit ScpB [Pseudobutyrivibrio sp.]|nr:SMC-Scp complex subunit ScpB [Pseudobutyrivibrio sp.]